MKLYRLINIEYNSWNALIIEVLRINERCLFAINISFNFLLIDLFYRSIIIFDKTENIYPMCDECGKKLTLVRPGKYQCDNENCPGNGG